jgi:hypothetical protein
MELMNESVMSFPRTKSLFLFLTFTAITLAPLTMIHSQWITGPLVNAMLILTCVLVGPMEAVILGLFPGVIALISGLLAPMIPFIMIGNAVFVAVFWYVKEKNMTLGIIAGALLKFLFLAATVRFLMVTILDAPIVQKLAIMMSWPQFATAIIGGTIAIGILSFLPSRD